MMNSVTSDNGHGPALCGWDVYEAIIKGDDLKPYGQSPDMVEKSLNADMSVETAMKEMSEQFTIAVSFICELARRIELLQGCVMTIESTGDIADCTMGTAHGGQIRAALLVASSELLEAVRGLIVKTRVS